MRISILLFTFILVQLQILNGQSVNTTEKLDKNVMIEKVNTIRAKGCYCGRRWMNPTTPLIWNSTLEKSAKSHAKEMDDNNFFGHYSKDGKNIGERFDIFGYRWKYAGENIAEGQETLDQVLQDWVNSKSHCQMLMNPTMKEMGLIKYKNLWVHHFGAKNEEN
jgi:uncharacterized protein YkwD